MLRIDGEFMPNAELHRNGRDISLAYLERGRGHPVLLIHGFASNKEVNWLNTGWVGNLADAGYRVVAFDNRGHGASTKFYGKADYCLEEMVADARGLMNHLEISNPHVIGYSMGAHIAAKLAIAYGESLGKIVLSGKGWSMVEGSGDWDPVRRALLAPSLEDVTDPRGRAFRKFANQTESDLRALAACVSGARQLVSEVEMRSIANSVLVAVGTEDEVAGSGKSLAAILPHGLYLPIPGRDHMRAVGDKVHIAGALEFLAD